MEYQIEDAERSECSSNGMGLLNGQTTKRDSIASVQEVGVGMFKEQGFGIQDRVAKCNWVIPESFKETYKRLP
jgi:hypothetical protein